MTDWTDEQLLAIDKEGTNIIVSAGAGSGKTAVLTERVIRKLKSGVSINNLLILTFTNKAAYEMKDRIRNAISEDQSIISQLDYIDNSYITTFDSYALSIVKKYSYLLNVSKNVTIADSSTIYLEKKRVIDDIFDRLYQDNNELFLKLIDDFTIKKDDDIKKYILDINDKLDLKYNKIEYLDNYLNDYYSENNINYLIDSYIDLLNNKIKEINNLLTLFSNYVDMEYFTEYMDSFTNLLNSKDYQDIKNNINISTPNLPRGSSDDAKKTKEKIKDLTDSLKELTRYENKEELYDTLKSTRDYVSIIIDIIKELDKRINEFKTNLNIYEFSDIAKMSIKVLKENKNICDEIKYSLNEIMIDEYQDTSDLQEEFISLIENNNVYMVGDIKQSIYRFRNANPYLFKSKYDNYNKNINGFKIDLTNNFRSRDEVVQNINLIFSSIMTDNMGGANYVESHKMLFGNHDYEKTGKLDISSNFEINNYEYDKELGYSKEEIEIFYIAKDIKEKVENKYQVFDKKSKQLRDINYSDFAILLDKSTNFDLYKKIFQHFNIPISKYTSTNITEEIEIVLFKNILKLLIDRRDNIYDVEFNYAFTSIARSNLFEYTDQEIFNIITNKKYDSSLLNTIDKVLENINTLSLKEIVYEIIDKFDFYSKLSLLGDTKNRVNRLTSIINIFDNLANINYTIDDAYNYLDLLLEDQYKIEVKELDIIPNSVKLMTIHASKGLEFPICYFASFHSKFNISELNEKFMFNNKYGIITPYFKEGIGKTFVKELVKDNYLKEEISEKIRLLYVALTRAREKFIIVTSLEESKINDIKDSRSFLDMINYIKDIINPYVKNIDINSLNLSKDYDLIKKSNYKESISKTDNKLELKEINIPNTIINNEKISKRVNNLLSKEEKDNMKLGTYIHEILELIDFNNPNIDELDIENFYKEKLKGLFNSIDVENTINIYKEYEFIYTEEDTVRHGIIDLLLEYSNCFQIIDYKLKGIEDEHYKEQLNSYKKYLETKTNKKIEIFLFSILDGTLKKID